jgi:predicted RNase H-like HicB family nuclease
LTPVILEVMLLSQRLILNFKGTIVITQEEDLFVAACLENHIASQGKTIDEAIANLKEAIALYYEDEKEALQLMQNNRVYITTLEMAVSQHNGGKISDTQARKNY